MILAPLRGVTIRCFRETFAEEIREAGFTEAVTPFIAAMKGYDPLKDRELEKSSNRRIVESSNRRIVESSNPRIVESSNRRIVEPSNFRVTPQFIGKDPAALRDCLEKVKAAGFDTADLNCGCPFPMVRNKGRGSGILRTPDVLRQMLEVGCEVMGPDKFSIKARLGIDRSDELLKLMPLINEFPLRFLTVHARTARQMYAGVCDAEGLKKVAEASKVPLVFNGDIPFPPDSNIQTFEHSNISLMVGRSFVRYLGTREDSCELLGRYIAASQAELCGDRPVLGRMKELISYWKDVPQWKRLWNVIKLCRSVDELRSCLPQN